MHWDDLETRLVNPPRASATTRARMRALTDDVARIAPRTRVVSPRYLDPMRLR